MNNRFSALSMEDESPSFPKTKVSVGQVPKRVPMAYIPPHLRGKQQTSTAPTIKKEEFPSLSSARTPTTPSPTKLSFAEKVRYQPELPKVEKKETNETEGFITLKVGERRTLPPTTTYSTYQSYSTYKSTSEYEDDNYEDLDHDVYGQTYNNHYNKNNYDDYDNDDNHSSELDQEDDQDY
jgi:hypothetical protein